MFGQTVHFLDFIVATKENNV